MRKSTFLSLLAGLFCLSFTTINPPVNKKTPPIVTAGVYLFIGMKESGNNPPATLTKGAGTADHPDEVMLQALSSGMAMPVTIGSSSGGTVGKPAISDFTLLKSLDKSSIPIQKALLSGGASQFEIRYYNGLTPEPVYKIVIATGYVSSYQQSSGTCGSNCPMITESISITPATTIQWTYITNSGTGGNTIQTLTYDIPTNTVK